MLRRKSKWRSKNQRRARKSPAAKAWEAQTRALHRKEAHDLAMASLAAEAQESIVPPKPSRHLLRFRITIECLTDGERVQFTTAEGPHGLIISPTAAGARVACVLKNYRPATRTTADNRGQVRTLRAF